MARRRRRRRQPARRSARVVPPLTAGNRTFALPSPRLLVAGAATLATVLFAGVVDAAPAKKIPSIPPPAVAGSAPPTAALKASSPAVPKLAPVKFHFVPAKERPPWGASLPSVSVTNNNTGAKDTFRIYSDHGSLDLERVKQFMTVANADSAGDTPKLDTRLVQLAFRAAYHFGGAAMTIVSGTRKGAHGKHGSGEALDFKLEGVKASDLAKYVRTFPRTGIGIYTHPKTQYVHVDVRERSYHWIDASPPGVTWREQLLADPKQEERDASYTATSDLPEVAR